MPGLLTTAYLALKLFQPDFEQVVVPFDQIEDAVHRGEVDVGLLIHEGQLTYGDAGLQLWADLGAWWLEDTGLPLPLGGNVVRRDLGNAVIRQIARDLRASIVYALEHRAPALAHAKQFNRGIGDERTDTFVGMYVNRWTVDYGARGAAGGAEIARPRTRSGGHSGAGGGRFRRLHRRLTRFRPAPSFSGPGVIPHLPSGRVLAHRTGPAKERARERCPRDPPRGG